jgi:hypothetical protein
VELFINTNHVTTSGNAFPQEFRRLFASTPSTLLVCISQSREEGAVKDSKRIFPPSSTHTPENVNKLKKATLQIPRRLVGSQIFLPLIADARSAGTNAAL